jgi:hypothetical protein
MANIWEHPSVIAEEALTHLEDALVIAPLCARDTTSEFTSKSNGWKVGDTVSFRTHGEYKVNEFTTTISTQPISTSSRPMEIEKHFDISVEVTAREQSLELDSFSAQVIRPAMYALGEACDTYFGTKLLEGDVLYVSDTLFATAADIALARKAAILQQLAMNRFCLVDLNVEAALLGQTWFNQAQTRGADGEESLREGDMGRVMGMDWFKSIAFPTNSTAHGAGEMVCVTDNGTDGVEFNVIGDTALIVDGQTASKDVAVGDRLAIAGVRRPLKVKTIIADTSATTSVALVDPITEIIPDNAAVTVIGSGQDLTFKGAIFDDRSLAVAFPMLDLPEDKVAATAHNNGVSVRIVKGYDMASKKTTLSLDFIVGAFMMDPRRCTLLAEY